MDSLAIHIKEEDFHNIMDIYNTNSVKLGNLIAISDVDNFMKYRPHLTVCHIQTISDILLKIEEEFETAHKMYDNETQLLLFTVAPMVVCYN